MLSNEDRNQTDLHRSKPNSRIFFINEQFNPFLQLHKKEKISRHRGDKQKCRYDRLIFIILLSLWFLLSDDQLKFHSF